MISKNLEKIYDNDNVFSISKSYYNLVSISNLIPKSSYDMVFSDLSLQFLSDSNGVI